MAHEAQHPCVSAVPCQTRAPIVGGCQWLVLFRCCLFWCSLFWIAGFPTEPFSQFALVRSSRSVIPFVQGIHYNQKMMLKQPLYAIYLPW